MPSSPLNRPSMCAWSETALVELSVFGLGLFEDGDVRVGVFPEGEEILVGGAGFGKGGIGVHGLCRGDARSCGTQTEVCATREAVVENGNSG